MSKISLYKMAVIVCPLIMGGIFYGARRGFYGTYGVRTLYDDENLYVKRGIFYDTYTIRNKPDGEHLWDENHIIPPRIENI